ncbi:hypothetical protein EW146_g3669 [Bondarzewia mesenterica]|uniref:Uncharacterized protein n=1 Tax=Bondarzewia mesenterica TaxID=1095465 RepID=A0A4S4M2N5_9AGAM|nr:hypothetical protein EW146_g3669 [Bondarzewia mesenterica]
MKNTLDINYGLNNNVGISGNHTTALWDAYGVCMHKMVMQFLTNFTTILGRLKLSDISVIMPVNIKLMFWQYLETSDELPVPVEWKGQQLTPFVPNMAAESVVIVRNIIGSMIKITSYLDIIPEVKNALAATRQVWTLTESAIKEKQLEIQRLEEQSRR